MKHNCNTVECKGQGENRASLENLAASASPKLGQLDCLSARAISKHFGGSREAKTSKTFTNDADDSNFDDIH